MNKLDPFEKLLNSKFQDNEVEFSYDSWDAIEQRLPSAPKSSLYYWIGAAIIIGSIVSYTIYLNTIPEKANKTHGKHNDSDQSSKVISSVEETNKKENDFPINEKLDKETTHIKANITPIFRNTTPISTENKNTENKKPLYEENNESAEAISQLHSYLKREQYGSWESSENTIKNIEEKTNLITDFSCSSNNSCVEDIIYFQSVDQKNVTYYWDFNDGNFSDLQNPEHQYKYPGVYLIQLTIYDNSDSTNLLQSEEYQIIINDKPTTEINMDSFEENGVSLIQFSQNNNDIQSITWDFGDGSKSNENNPIYRYMQKGNFLVTLSLTNSHSCSITTSQSINIDKIFNLMAPNSFTPNGDGINDYFIPESLKIMDVEFSMTIFNKTGKRVYETKNINQPWDGINQTNGQKCNEGSYVWVVTLTNKEGETEQYKGAILLLN